MDHIVFNFLLRDRLASGRSFHEWQPHGYVDIAQTIRIVHGLQENCLQAVHLYGVSSRSDEDMRLLLIWNEIEERRLCHLATRSLKVLFRSEEVRFFQFNADE